MSGQVRLNINTLNGDEFTINVGELKPQCSIFDIKIKISNHYTRKLLDDFIEKNNVDIPFGYSRYGRNNDEYFCGASDEVKNQIQKYRPQHQQLIYNNKILTHSSVVNNEVCLHDNDNITVVFT